MCATILSHLPICTDFYFMNNMTNDRGPFICVGTFPDVPSTADLAYEKYYDAKFYGSTFKESLFIHTSTYLIYRRYSYIGTSSFLVFDQSLRSKETINIMPKLALNTMRQYSTYRQKITLKCASITIILRHKSPN